jgi:hypothetical protein
LWYATAVQGEGLETPPKGPSELFRLAADGKAELVARDEKNVIISVITGPQRLLAYTLDNAQTFAMTAGQNASQVSLGKRRPLMFLPDGNLLARDGFDLVLIALPSGTPVKIGSLPEGSVSVFLMP